MSAPLKMPPRIRTPAAVAKTQCPGCGVMIQDPVCWCGLPAPRHGYGLLDHHFLIECLQCGEVFDPHTKTKGP